MSTKWANPGRPGGGGKDTIGEGSWELENFYFFFSRSAAPKEQYAVPKKT